MSFPPIPISEAVSQVLYDLARQTGKAPQEVLDQAVEDYRRKLASEPNAAATKRADSVEQMAAAWRAIGKPILADDAPLSVDPDDYPLY